MKPIINMPFYRIILIGLLLLACGSLPQPASAAPLPTVGTSSAFFIENSGQFDPSASFLLQNGRARLWVTRQALWLSWLETPLDFAPGQEIQTNANLRISFIGANPNPTLLPKNRLDTRVNYLTGDQAVSAPTWLYVIYKDLYPGIDLVLSAVPDAGSRTPFSWHLITRPGAAIDQVRLQIEGAADIQVNSTNLSLEIGLGMLHLPLLELPQEINRGFAGQPQVLEIEEDLFQINAPLAIAPKLESITMQANSSELEYSTYLGGSAWEVGHDIAITPDGMIYIVGNTASTDFPTTSGVFDRRVASVDAFITKFDPNTNQIVFSTILGGKSMDSAYAIALQGDQPYITGETQSSDFPTSPNAFDATCGSDGACDASDQGPNTDAFLARISADGARLVYSTYLGGKDEDRSYDIAADDQRVYLTGITYSADFPAQGNKGRGDLFAASFDQSYKLSYATLLGGSDVDAGFGIAVRQGSAYITGETSSPDIPAEGYQGNRDLLLASLDPNGVVQNVTLVGGTGEDRGNAIALDSSGRIQVTGFTNSADLPSTIGAYAGLGDALILVTDLQGNLTHLAYFGGTGYDVGLTIQANSGNVMIGGITGSADLPTTSSAFQTSPGGKLDAFLLQIDPSADPNSQLVYSSFLGGNSDDSIQVLALSAADQVYLAGYTQSSDFPVTQDALSTNIKSSQDAFLMRLKITGSPVSLPTIPPPTPTSTSLPATSLPLIAQTTATQFPQATLSGAEATAPQPATLTPQAPPIVSTSQPNFPSTTTALPERADSTLSESAPLSSTASLSGESLQQITPTPATSVPEDETTSPANQWLWVIGLLILGAIGVTAWLLIRRRGK